MTADFLEATRAAIQARSASNEPSWLADLRERAQSSFDTRGFPTTKDEAWRFTSVRQITRVPFEARPSATTPSSSVPEGVEVRRLADILAQEPDVVRPHLGQISEAEFFGALNAAMFDDALVIRIRKGAVIKTPIELSSTAQNSEPTVVYPRTLIVSEENSQATIIERHSGKGAAPHLSNSVTEISLAADAQLNHHVVHHGWSAGHRISSIAARQARGSRYRSHVFTFGGALTRLDLRSALTGEGAECSLDGLYLAGDGEHVDHQTLVDHQSPHCLSSQKYKGMVDGKGRAVFDGTVVVRKDAQRTEAHQENRNLLLSDSAIVNTKPHLEIDADDVTCSHGATIGQLDPKQLFYLRARGIDAEAARSILTHAFARELIERVPLTTLADELDQTLLRTLPAGALAREVL